MDRGFWVMAAMFLGAIVVLVGFWLFERKWGRTRIGVVIDGLLSIAVGGWALYVAATGLWRGRIDMPGRGDYIFWRDIESLGFWMLVAVWVGLGIVLFARGARTLCRVVNRQGRHLDNRTAESQPSSNSSSSGREEA